jgi:hypothetical protein
MLEVPFRACLPVGRDLGANYKMKYNIEAFIVLKKEFARFICLRVQVNFEANFRFG